MNERDKRVSARIKGAVLAATLAIAGSSLAFSQLGDGNPESKGRPVQVVVNDTPVKRDGKFTTSFSPVVKKVAPSVVNVFTTTKIKQTRRVVPPGWNDPFFRRFFGDEFEGQLEQQRSRAPRQSGLGSGVIISKDGYILTNNHVVENADEIKVALTDEREFTAKVVGRDPKTEIAVLKIEADNLPYIELANSDQIEVGDIVLAVGNPFGIGQTVTMGMVSATGRGNVGLDYEDFIQTDAAINPGNSGGALVDAEGRLVGINTMILSRSGGNQGIGFAVPVNLARNVMEQLIQNGKVVRGYLGIYLQDVTPALAKEFDLEESTHGVLISDVTAKSPAEKSGLKSGDVVVEFDGKKVRDSRHLKLQVGQTAPGKKVPVTVLRDGKSKKIEVTLKEMPSDEEIARTGSGQAAPGDDALDGVVVSDIENDARRQFQIPRELKGALVTSVDPESAAYRAGLREGHVIQEINRQKVDNAEQAVELSKDIKDKNVLLRVWSRGGSHFLVVDEEKVG